MLIIAVNFPNVFPCSWACVWSTPHYRYFRSEGYGGQARLYALVPYCHLLYSPTDGHALNFSFSNRISRPSQNMVNPFPFYQNKYTYACGREDLKPSYTLQCRTGIYVEEQLQCFCLLFLFGRCILPGCGLGCRNECDSFLWENFMQTHAFGLNNSYTFRTKWLQTYAQHGGAIAGPPPALPPPLPRRRMGL